MKQLKLSCALVFALLASVPGFAQKGNDSEVKAVVTKFFEAFNAGKVEEAAALWSPDAVDINVNGLISGKTQLDTRIARELKMGLKIDHTIERIQVVDNLAWAAGPYTVKIPSKDGAAST